jgi:hypothetical protein
MEATSMKQITLSQGKVALVDDDGHERLSQFRWFYKPERNFHQGYAFRHGRKTDSTKMVYLHREIAAAPPGHEVLFLNNDHLDCRRENLRVVTSAEARQQRTMRLQSKPGSRRVRIDHHTGSWHAHIYLSDGRRHYVGEFGFKEEAHEACQVALQRKNPELHPVTMVVDRGVHS